MKIKYLGTAAAEGIPALFCECETCKKARLIKGKNIRSRSQMLINDDLLIDYPPDSFYHFNLYNIDFSKIRNLIISHNHEDHFYPLDFYYFLKGFSVPINCLPFTIYGSVDLKPSLEPIINNERNQGLRYVEMKAFETYQVGDYLITPLKASHGTVNPFIYIVSDKKKTILYCHDSGPLKDETIDYLINHHVHFDLISMDSTAGNKDINWSNHMCVKMIRDIVNLFLTNGIIDKTTKVVLNHFSHNGDNVLYDDMVKTVKEDGYLVSYDGLEIKL